MNTLAHLRIGPRIALAFALTLLLMLVVALFAGGMLTQVNRSLHLVTDDYYVKVQLVGQIQDEINKQARFARNLLIMDAGPARDGEAKGIADSRTVVRARFDTLTPLVRSETGKQRLNEVMAARASYVQSLDRFLGLVQQDNLAEARTHLLQELRGQQLAYMTAMDRFSAFQEQLMSEASAEADRDAQQGIWAVGSVSGVAVLVASLLGFLLTRSITRPLAHAVLVAQTVAAGDLTSRVQSQSRDEVGQLLSALGSMNTALADLVSKVRSASEAIATGATQIATGSVDLSQRTEEQASNLEETAASMEELAVTVKQNADSAQAAMQLAQQAATAAGECGNTVESVVITMSEISRSSHQIEAIVDVIDSIAFQTNILALNAAVEAARAGEQGRGFAVVASEVRALAQRSATAAKEIKALIETSTSRVNKGNEQATSAQSTMQAVVNQVDRVNKLIDEIGSASAEQTSGIGQVSDAVQQLDQVTQQNAALVEESTAASESLRAQAIELTAAVSLFRLPPAGRSAV